MWGEYSDRAGGIALLRGAVAAGTTFIDTADVYGPHSNEILIRDALHPYPAGLVIATKGGLVRGGLDDWGVLGNRTYLRQCVHMSARRLGVERIDLYYLHSARATDVPFEEQVATLAELREEGLIRHIGLSNVTVAQFNSARAIVDIAAVTMQYNVGYRTKVALLNAAETAGIPFSPWYPSSMPKEEHAARFSDILGPIAQRHGTTVHQITLAWLLHRSPLMLPIPGTTNLAHLKENRAAVTIRLTNEEVSAITALTPEE
jgi:aryl-alcohol dehydrogenase-like predicted oxidoreductase